MAKRLFILIGGVQNGDYEHLPRLVHSGGTARWSSLKHAEPGDRVLIYIQRPYSALIASAEVVEHPKKGQPGDYAYRAKVGRFQLLPNRLTLSDLKEAFPKWSWLRMPRRGIEVPTAIADRLWKELHENQSTVQILISNSKVGYRSIQNLAKNHEQTWWSAPKLTRKGDTVLFYVEGPVSAIVATGKALSSTRPTDKKWHEVRVGSVELLPSPLPLGELREMFPEWQWLKHMAMFAYVSSARAEKLLARCAQTTSAATQAGTAGKGAGFGDPESNKLVEQAAMRKVTRYLRQRGYSVHDRSMENLGYDLEARAGSKVLLIEVKGVSGDRPEFVITPNELNCSQRESRFVLMAVTKARSRQAKIHEFTGAKLRKAFDISPLSYFARRK